MSRIPTAVALVLALGGLGVAAGCGEPDDGPTASTPTGPDCQDFDETSDEQPVDPGAWCLRAAGAADAPYAVVEVPDGYVSWSGFLKPPGEPSALVSYWTVESVYEDPCTRAGGAVDPGPSVQDLADALGRQRITDTTEPVPVTLDGHDGLYLELTFPAEMDFGPCLEPELYVWEADDRVGARWEDILGVVDSYWILDVDGRRVVLAASRVPQLPESGVAELKGILESAEFVESA